MSPAKSDTHTPCEDVIQAAHDVTKARSDIVSLKWVLGVLLGIAISAAVMSCNAVLKTAEKISFLERRADVTEDRYERTQDDIAEIKRSVGEIKKILEHKGVKP